MSKIKRNAGFVRRGLEEDDDEEQEVVVMGKRNLITLAQETNKPDENTTTAEEGITTDEVLCEDEAKNPSDVYYPQAEPSPDDTYRSPGAFREGGGSAMDDSLGPSFLASRAACAPPQRQRADASVIPMAMPIEEDDSHNRQMRRLVYCLIAAVLVLCTIVVVVVVVSFLVTARNETDASGTTTGDTVSPSPAPTSSSGPEPTFGPLPTNETEPKCTIVSEFDTSAEGWTLIGDAQGASAIPSYHETGGNPGGYISAIDEGTGEYWHFRAPNKFHGDFTAAYNYSLSFDLRQSNTVSQADRRDVIISDTTGTLIWFDTKYNPSTDWTSYEISISEVAGWLSSDDTPASESNIRSVLSNIKDILIRGEYVVGADTGSLDNVELTFSCSDSEAVCSVISDFETDDEGWSLMGDAIGDTGERTDEPAFSGTGGNPGGHIIGFDEGTGETWYFRASDAFHGGFSGAYGNTISFDLIQSAVDIPHTDRDVIIFDMDGTLIWFNMNTSPGSVWTSYSVTMNEDAGWQDSNDAIASEPVIRAVLGNIGDIWIRGEYAYGGDIGGLDNVILTYDC